MIILNHIHSIVKKTVKTGENTAVAITTRLKSGAIGIASIRNISTVSIRHSIWVLVLLGLVSTSCRKQLTPTEIDMSDYGWVLYEEGLYLESNEWFNSSVIEDSTYKDGYNGLGWTFGKLVLLDSSIFYFKEGDTLSQTLDATVSLDHEIFAGLCFAYNADGQDSLSVLYGDILITEINESPELKGTWTFSHDKTMNHLDIRLTLAASNYAIGAFNTSLDHVLEIYREIIPTKVFNPNVSTVEGRRELANEIEDLRTLLTSP